MNAKKVKVMHDKKGVVELGSLSKNELCRGVADLMEEHAKIQQALNMVIGNMFASADAV